LSGRREGGVGRPVDSVPSLYAGKVSLHGIFMAVGDIMLLARELCIRYPCIAVFAIVLLRRDPAFCHEEVGV
jgi:hypothetical protein